MEKDRYRPELCVGVLEYEGKTATYLIFDTIVCDRCWIVAMMLGSRLDSLLQATIPFEE